MTRYCVFESTNMKSSRFSERIFDCVCSEDIENGTFGYLGEQEEEGSHVYKFKKGFKAGETVVVADQPAWKEDYRRTADMRRDKFIIPAGTRFRVRVVAKNDEFAITIEGVTPATRDKMKLGAFLTIDETTGKLVAAETAQAIALLWKLLLSASVSLAVLSPLLRTTMATQMKCSQPVSRFWANLFKEDIDYA